MVTERFHVISEQFEPHYKIEVADTQKLKHANSIDLRVPDINQARATGAFKLGGNESVLGSEILQKANYPPQAKKVH